MKINYSWQSFVHVSTAYSNADKANIEEIVYKPPFDPQTFINLINKVPNDVAEALVKKMMVRKINNFITYSFSVTCIFND